MQSRITHLGGAIGLGLTLTLLGGCSSGTDPDAARDVRADLEAIAAHIDRIDFDVAQPPSEDTHDQPLEKALNDTLWQKFSDDSTTMTMFYSDSSYTGTFVTTYMDAASNPIRFSAIASLDTIRSKSTLEITLDKRLEITGSTQTVMVMSSEWYDFQGNLRYRFLEDGFIMDMTDWREGGGPDTSWFSGTLVFFGGEYRAPFEECAGPSDLDREEPPNQILRAPLLNRRGERVGTVELLEDDSVVFYDSDGNRISASRM